jgi:predicted XRE-type DNA-binding protein
MSSVVALFDSERFLKLSERGTVRQVSYVRFWRMPEAVPERPIQNMQVGMAGLTRGVNRNCALSGREMRRRTMPNQELTASSGNVLADLNLRHADDLLGKAQLAAKIIAEIQRRRLTQNQVAAILGIDQPKVSSLKQGKLSGFRSSG